MSRINSKTDPTYKVETQFAIYFRVVKGDKTLYLKQCVWTFSNGDTLTRTYKFNGLLCTGDVAWQDYPKNSPVGERISREEFERFIDKRRMLRELSK